MPARAVAREVLASGPGIDDQLEVLPVGIAGGDYLVAVPVGAGATLMPSSSTPPLSPSVFADTQANLAAAKFHAYEKVRLLGRGQHGAAVLLRSPATGQDLLRKWREEPRRRERS